MANTKRIAFTASDGHLDAPLSGHFGHTRAFFVIEFDEESKEILGTGSITNPPHVEGGCLTPVMILKNNGVDYLVVIGIGGRPFMGLQQQDIGVLRGINGTIRDNFNAFCNNQLEVLYQSTCQH